MPLPRNNAIGYAAQAADGGVVVAKDGDGETVMGEMQALDGRGTVSDDVAETSAGAQCGRARHGGLSPQGSYWRKWLY